MTINFLKFIRMLFLTVVFCSFGTGLLADVSVVAFSGEFNQLSRLAGLPVRLYLAGDKPVSGDGKSWDGAYNNWDSAMQEATRLVSSGYSVELWAQSGEYLINPVSLPSNFGLYGGFDGTERDLSDRNLYVTTTNSTVFSPAQPSADLLTLSGVSNVIFNGLVIGGVTNATAVNLSDCDATVVFQACLIRGNTNQTGGAAMKLLNSSPSLEFCWIADNQALGVDALGGAIQIVGNSAPRFSACTLNRNVSKNGMGGAIFFNGSSARPFVLQDCHLIANSAAAGASSLYVKAASGQVIMTNCVVAFGRVTHNVSTNRAGGVHAEGTATVPAHLEISGTETLLCDHWKLNSTNGYEFTPSVSYTNAVITKVNLDRPIDELSRLVLDDNGVPDVFQGDSYFSTLDKKEVRRFFLNLPMLSELPAPGKKVRVQFAEYAGTAVYHSLYLPPDWEPGKRYPVFMDIPGNPFYHQWGDYSTGKPESSPMGYGISEGKAICIGLPCIDTNGTMHVGALGDVPRTVDYMKKVAVSVCDEWGGDPARMILCGYSRGGIGTSFLGRYDDEIADVWLGWLHYDGFDQWYETNIYMRAASFNVTEDDWDVTGGIARRFARIKGRSTCIVNGGYVGAFADYNVAYNYPYAYFNAAGRNHSPIWSIAETVAGSNVRGWYRDTLQNLPGTGSISGIITDSGGQPLSGAKVQTGLTRFAYSDAQGQFTLEGLPVGYRTFVVTAAGSTFNSAQITIEVGINAPHNWQAQ